MPSSALPQIEEDETPSTYNGSKSKRSSIWSMVKKPRKSISAIRQRFRFGPNLGVDFSKADMNVFGINAKETFSKIHSVVSLTSASAISVVDKLTPATQKVSVAKWSKKLYGSEKAVIHEEERLQEINQFVIHPFSNFRLSWDVLCTFIILADIVIIPMDIAFSTQEEDHRILWFKLISDIWFAVDIILNFRTGVHLQNWDKRTLCLDPKKIAKWYFRGWFTVDLITTLPLDFIVNYIPAQKTVDDSMKYLPVLKQQVVKAFSLIKVARLPRLIRGISHLDDIINLQYDITVSVMRFTYIVFSIFMTCHINGCLQYMIPMFYGFPDDTWVKIRGLHLPNVTWREAYTWSLFKSTSQMICIGFSQITPIGMLDLWMTLYSQTTGAVIFAIFIGNAIAIMEESDAPSTAYASKMGQIQQYLSFRRMPASMRRLVVRNCQTRYRGKLFDEREILKELSPILRHDVVWHNTSDLILSVPLFEDVDDDFTYELGCKLHYVIYMPKETIVREGSQAHHMFFICSGEVEIISKSFSGILGDGAHFGEASLFSSEMRRSADVVAITTVHVYLLDRTDYLQLRREHPDQAEKIDVCARRLRHLSARYDFVKNYSRDLDPNVQAKKTNPE